MSFLVSLDAYLVVLGCFALSPRLWYWLVRWRTKRPPLHDRPRRGATAILFYLGVVSLALAAVDGGLAVWQFNTRSEDAESGEMRTDLFPQVEEAPDFSLPSLQDGRTVRLSDYRGHKPVVLVFGSFS
jgi:hypothetical protein